MLASATTATRLLPCALRPWGCCDHGTPDNRYRLPAKSSEDSSRFAHSFSRVGDPGANSGGGAQRGSLAPGPGRGRMAEQYEQLKAAGGVAPARWQFDEATGGWKKTACHGEAGISAPSRQVRRHGWSGITTVLTISHGQDGDRRWELRGDARSMTDAPALPLRALHPGDSRQPLFAGQGANERISGGSRGRDAAGRGLPQAGLFGSLHRWRGRGRLTAHGNCETCGDKRDAPRIEESTDVFICDKRYGVMVRALIGPAPPIRP